MQFQLSNEKAEQLSVIARATGQPPLTLIHQAIEELYTRFTRSQPLPEWDGESRNAVPVTRWQERPGFALLRVLLTLWGVVFVSAFFASAVLLSRP